MGAKKSVSDRVVAVTASKRPIVSSKTVIIVLSLLLAALVIGAIVVYAQNKRHNDSKSPAATRQAVLKDSGQLNRSRNYSDEAKELQAYIDSKPPAEYAETEIIRLAAAYVNAGDYDKAIATYQKAINDYPGVAFAGTRGLAFAYMQRGENASSKGDFQKALEYFEKCLAIEKADQQYSQLIPSDESNVRYLKGKLQ